MRVREPVVDTYRKIGFPAAMEYDRRKALAEPVFDRVVDAIPILVDRPGAADLGGIDEGSLSANKFQVEQMTNRGSGSLEPVLAKPDDLSSKARRARNQQMISRAKSRLGRQGDRIQAVPAIGSRVRHFAAVQRNGDSLAAGVAANGECAGRIGGWRQVCLRWHAGLRQRENGQPTGQDCKRSAAPGHDLVVC